MCSRSRALCDLSKVLPEIYVVLEVRIIEEMNGSLLFLAKGLSLGQPFRRFGTILVPKFDKSLLYHM
jgi:hypothetical protein